jgi:DNA-binding NtrC family response regulator
VNDAQFASETNNALSVSTLTQPSCAQTILLVEDEAFVREMVAEILEGAGYRVLKARNAAEAKNAFRHFGKIVQLLLTDVILPGQNGRELAKDLREINSALRVICTSGYSLNLVSQKRLVEDEIFYFPKPFSADSLLRKVRQVLANDLEAGAPRPAPSARLGNVMSYAAPAVRTCSWYSASDCAGKSTHSV